MYQVHTAAERADLRAAWRGAGAAALRCAFIWCAKNALFESHVNSKNLLLPRQARDRHGESGEQEGRFLRGRFSHTRFLRGRFLRGRFLRGRFLRGRFLVGGGRVALLNSWRCGKNACVNYFRCCFSDGR